MPFPQVLRIIDALRKIHIDIPVNFAKTTDPIRAAFYVKQDGPDTEVISVNTIVTNNVASVVITIIVVINASGVFRNIQDFLF